MLRSSIGYAIFAAVLVASGTAVAASTASLDLLARAANPNPTLNSYTASAQLSAILHVVIPVHKAFPGSVYYLRPNRKIEFQNVPSDLARFKDLVSTTPTYEQATRQYTIAPLADDGTVSKYLLVPKKTGGRVKSVLVTVNDQSALISSALWSYTNGGSLNFTQTYETVGSYRLPAKANIAARFPGYSVDGILTFSNYQPNATVSPSVFASPH